MGKPASDVTDGIRRLLELQPHERMTVRQMARHIVRERLMRDRGSAWMAEASPAELEMVRQSIRTLRYGGEIYPDGYLSAAESCGRRGGRPEALYISAAGMRQLCAERGTPMPGHERDTTRSAQREALERLHQQLTLAWA